MKTNNLLMNFLKEEVRLHTSLYKRSSFFSYPITMFIFFAFITAGSIFVYDNFNQTSVALVLINLFFVGGIMSGAFGLYAQDYLERKFGDFGRLFSNTQILPIKLNKTFLTLAMSDTIFYLGWFIIPTILGFGFGNLIMGQSISKLFLLIISAFLIFMIGIFTTFFLSVLYEKSRILFTGFFLILLGLILYYFVYLGLPVNSFWIHNFYLTGNLMSLLYSIILICALAILSYISIGRNFGVKIRKNIQMKSLTFPKTFNHYIFKDYIDLKRTGGLFGKPLFTVLIPSALLLFLFSTMDFLQTLNIDTLFFSIVFGTLGTQLLNSLINSDDFRYYRYLPISLKNYITSKIKLSFIICFIFGLLILLIYSFSTGNFSMILKSTILLITVLIYNFCLSFYLTGLQPNENLMQSKTFIVYFVLYIPILFVAIMLNILWNSIMFYLLFLFVSLLISKYYLKKGIRVWEN